WWSLIAALRCTFVPLFCFCLRAAHRALLSFPTRRSSDLPHAPQHPPATPPAQACRRGRPGCPRRVRTSCGRVTPRCRRATRAAGDRKSTRLNSSHVKISYAVFCLKKKIVIDLSQTVTQAG